MKKCTLTVAAAAALIAAPTMAADLAFKNAKKGDVFAGIFLDANGDVIERGGKESRPLARDRSRYVFSFPNRPPKGAKQRCFLRKPAGKRAELIKCIAPHMKGTLTVSAR